MKKSLFAVAALSAIAGAAQAQSSVTVYGLLDMGYVGANARAVSSTGVVTKTQYSQFGQSQENTSRLGFKGVEDLGGGTSAFFTVELGLTPQNPAIGGGTAADAWQKTDQNGGSSIDNRQSFAGLKKNGIGQFAFGRQYTPIFNAGAATDASQYANVAGNVIYQSPLAADVNGGTGSGAGFTNRASNALTVQSDSFAGFKVSGMYALNNTNQTQTTSTTSGGNTNWNGWGLSADYTWQKLFATVAYQSFKSNYTNGIYSSAGATNLGTAGTSGQLPVAGLLFNPSLISDKQTYAAATYDFGILKAYIQWVGRKIQNDTSFSTTYAGEQVNRTAQQIGVRSYITPTIESWASIGTGKYKGAPLNASTAAASVNFVGWQLGGNYYLSKRTNLYAIYGQGQTSSSVTGTAGSGSSQNQYTVGMRHTF